MARRMNWICMEIADILEATERQVTVLDALSGKAVRLPRCEIEFGPRKVFVSEWAFAKIYQPTIEKVMALKC
jgi:hypothetical protein